MKTPISPKIWAGVNAATLVAMFITLLGSIGPGALDFLGKWAPLAYAAIPILTFAGAAYLKSDSLREAGLAALQKAAEEAAAAAAKPSTPAVPVTEAPASVFPAAKVEAAAAPEPSVAPVTVTPVLPEAPVA